MAVTVAHIWSTPYADAYLLTAAGADTANLDYNSPAIASPDLNTDTIGQLPLHDLVKGPFTNQAAARAAFGLGVAAKPEPRGSIKIDPISGAVGASWSVDANVVGTLLRFNIACQGAGIARLVVRRTHSMMGK